MKFGKRISNFFKGAKQKTLAFFSSSMRIDGQEDWYDALNLSTFKESLYLFIGVSMIRDTVASIPLQLYKIKNADGDVEEIFDDPILDILGRPNFKQTQREFMQLSVSYYLLAGETFWYLERGDNTGTPTAMANMRPDYVEIVLSEDKKQIVAYEFWQANGTTIKLPPEDVLHFKNIDPTNPARGVGVIRPATQRIITEKEAARYQAQVFKNQGRPDIAVFVNADIDEEEGERARENWNKIYGNPDKPAGAGFFGQDIKDIKLLNVSPKEMGYIESQKFLRDDILNALRIPPQMIDIDVNYSNSLVARATYIRNACEPVLDTFIDIINNKWFVDQNVADDRFLTYETEVNDDRELTLKEAKELKEAGIITVNEARGLMNFPEVEDGDIREQGGSMFQLSLKNARLRKKAQVIIRKRIVLQRKFKAVDAVAKMYREEKMLKGVKRGQSSVFFTEDMKNAYIKAFNNNIDKKARLFKDTVDVYNDGMLKRIVKQMEDFGINPQNIFDLSVEVQEAKSAFVPLMKAMYSQAGQETMDNIATGFSQKASEQFFTVDEVIQELENRAEFFILSMLDTDFKQLQEIIAGGLADGKGVDEIARNLRKYFDDMSAARARTIARTETGRLVSMATDEAYRQSSVVTGKEWLTARDSKVRDKEDPNNHVKNDGTIVPPGGTFPNGERFPGELTINCRCAIAPAV